MSNIQIQDIPHESFVFSGGEIQVKLDTSEFWGNHTTITARVKSAHDLIELLLVLEALGGEGITVDLTLPYLPYARQDRVCVKGEAHGVRFIMDILQAYEDAGTLNAFTVYDVHSDVPLAWGNLHNVPQDTILQHYSSHFKGYDTLISPDAGSLKKIYKAATALGIYDVVKADKVRDVLTGEIEATEVYAESLKGKHCLIVDDICDGGRTFIELAKVLKAKGAESVGLYVTHGLFSKGYECIYDSGIEEIYTTDSWEDRDYPYSDEITILPAVKEGLR